MIHAGLNVEVIDSPDQIAESKTYFGKPFVRISNPDGRLELTFNQMGMLFGAVKGNAELLWKQGRLPTDNIPPEWVPDQDVRHKAAVKGVHALLHLFQGAQPSCVDEKCKLHTVANEIVDVMKSSFK